MPSFASDTPPNGFVSYALNLIGDWLGQPFRIAPTEEVVDVFYGQADRRCRLRIPYVDQYTETSVPLLPADAGGAPPEHTEDPFPFDIFSAMRFWLADEGNRAAEGSALDLRGRVLAESSVQGRTQTLDRPVVNAYLLAFGRWLEARAGITAKGTIPPGKRCVIALTHDVDLPIDPGNPGPELRLALRALRAGVRPRRTAETAARRTARAAVSHLRREGRHWLFPEVIEAERSHGFSSVFFFAATTRYDPEGHELDVGYDVRSPRFRGLMRELQEGGAEVGLHIGFRAGSDAAFIRRERELVEEASGRPVLGSRHHFFMPHPFWGALEAHGRAGLHYDTSVGFNESPGYRLGVALPFHPWNPAADSPIACAQIPTFAMDAALFADHRVTTEAAVTRVAHLVDQLKRAEGVAALDWHEYTSWPGARSNAAWGRAYLEILDLLASDPQVDVRPAGALASEALGSPNVDRYQP